MKLTIKKNYPYDLMNKRFHFIVIGCGGNGSFLIRDLARLIAIKNQDFIKEFEEENRRYQTGSLRRKPSLRLNYLTVIDGDIVEEKNIRRQNFIPADIGNNKAEIMAQRYSAAYGNEIYCLSEYIKDATQLFDIALGIYNGSNTIVPVIIGCVDNNATRSLMAECMNMLKSRACEAFWLDSGNEEFSGQVVLGSTKGRFLSLVPDGINDGSLSYYIGSPSDKGYIFNMPMVTQVYPEILDITDKRPDQMSCDDRAVSFPQCIATNITIATLLLDFCNHFINMPEAGIETCSVNFNVNKINFGTKFNCKEDHSDYCENPIWHPPVLNVSPKQEETEEKKDMEAKTEEVREFMEHIIAPF